MARQSRAGSRRPRRLWLAIALGLALLAGGGLWYVDQGGPGWPAGWWPSAEEPAPTPDPVTAPALVLPPPEVSLPALRPPSPVAASLAGEGRSADLDPAAVRLAMTPGLLDRRLGRHVVAAVTGLRSGEPVLEAGSGPFIPASTTKLLTAAAALETLGPAHVFETRVVAGGRRGSVVLVGGGDPYLVSGPLTADGTPPPYPERANLVTLAARTAAALRERGVTRVRVGYDDSLFTGPAVNPAWEPDYLTDEVVAPISALWVDGAREPSGFGRVEDPSATAAAAFADALRRAGVRVLGAPQATRAPARARRLASVRSAPLERIVERAVEVSDNEASEVLAHHVGLAVSGEGSFEGGAAGTVATLRRLGLPMTRDRLYDGSGLSRGNRLTTQTLLGLLRLAAHEDHPRLRAVLTGLPVAGFTGSLAYRFSEGAPAGRGRVRAKTGTLTGVHGLAGVATGLDGVPAAFVLVADRVRPRHELTARGILDEVAGALGACRCAR